ncbi:MULTISPECIES: ROK family transcriptional regulator [Roseobacteraceae]|uniref:ROK family transcriptional regulator n=1 Tax=Roseobacteraceae TaxID=2854170 RepID=UPI0014738120|nr:ROK family transcriptional regulator [Roseovarius confluentis]
MLPLQSRQVLGELLLNGALPRSVLAKRIGVSQSVITRVTQSLISDGYLLEGSALSNTAAGRRAVELLLRPDQHHVVGLAINAYRQSASVSDLTGRVIASRQIPRIAQSDPESTLQKLSEVARELVAEAGVPESTLLAVGVACVGQVDRTGRWIATSPDLGWNDVAVADLVGADLGLPVFVDSMQNALNETERKFGKGGGMQNTLLVSVALGIGASCIVDGNLLRGRQPVVATMGHMPVNGIGHGCNCGRKGCLATVASGFAVLRMLGLVEEYAAPGPHDAALVPMLTALIERSRDDEAVSSAFRTAGHYLGQALKSAVTVTSPDAILLWGPVAQVDTYRAGIEDALRPNSSDPFGWDGEIVVSETPLDHAAARLALDRFAFCTRPKPKRN